MCLLLFFDNTTVLSHSLALLSNFFTFWLCCSFTFYHLKIYMSAGASGSFAQNWSWFPSTLCCNESLSSFIFHPIVTVFTKRDMTIVLWALFILSMNLLFAVPEVIIVFSVNVINFIGDPVSIWVQLAQVFLAESCLTRDVPSDAMTLICNCFYLLFIGLLLVKVWLYKLIQILRLN